MCGTGRSGGKLSRVRPGLETLALYLGYGIWAGRGGRGQPTPASMPSRPGHPAPSLPWRTSPLNTNTYDFPPTQPLTKEERARRARSRCFLGQKAANPALSHRRGLRTT